MIDRLGARVVVVAGVFDAAACLDGASSVERLDGNIFPFGVAVHLRALAARVDHGGAVVDATRMHVRLGIAQGGVVGDVADGRRVRFALARHLDEEVVPKQDAAFLFQRLLFDGLEGDVHRRGQLTGRGIDVVGIHQQHRVWWHAHGDPFGKVHHRGAVGVLRSADELCNRQAKLHPLAAVEHALLFVEIGQGLVVVIGGGDLLVRSRIQQEVMTALGVTNLVALHQHPIGGCADELAVFGLHPSGESGDELIGNGVGFRVRGGLGVRAASRQRQERCERVGVFGKHRH